MLRGQYKGIKFEGREEKYKITVMAILLAGACFLTYYFHTVLGIETIFSHFFYIPIIFASLCGKRKGLVVAVFLAFLLLFSHSLRFGFEMSIIDNIIRATFFIIVAYVVGLISEKRAERDEEIQKLNEELESKVEERAKDLAKERNYVRHLIESSPDFQMTLDKGGKIMDVNEAFEKIVGKSREEIIGTSIYQYLPKEGTEKAIARIFENRKVRNIELTADISGKGVLICNFSGTVFTTPEGEVGIYASGRDITERTRVEEKIKVSLAEKELLLREVHHRVKNNLEVISSLLDMSCMRTSNQQAINLFRDARAKIYGMALIHSQLYQSDRFDQIDMGEHVQELISYLPQIYAKGNSLVTPVIEVSDVHLSVTQAIPGTLILNELISNAYRHAFKEGQKGTVEISIQKSAGDTIFMRVKDDGIGIPEEIDIYKTDTMGLKLVRNLVLHQLKGKMQVERVNGTEIIIEFKILEEEVEDA